MTSLSLVDTCASHTRQGFKLKQLSRLFKKQNKNKTHKKNTLQKHGYVQPLR